MHFCLVDAVLDLSDDRVITIKQVSNAEEYLLDHFPGFPVLPGVMMIEALVQAARRLAQHRGHNERLVPAEFRAIKYGTFVRPGQTLRCDVTLKSEDGGRLAFTAEGRVITPAVATPATTDHPATATDGPIAVSGRFTLRPLTLQPPPNVVREPQAAALVS